MGRNSTYKILMYSHDTYGLGHIRRTMAIASQLRDVNVNILILTGSPIAGRFVFPRQIDFIRIPGMIKKTNDEYLPLSIKINPLHALAIRRNIITATAKTFQPHLFIVDKEPLGLKREVLPTLQWIRRCLPKSRTIYGLRDIMDDADTVRRDWTEKNVYPVLENLYSEIWVYGNREFYDPIREYAIPESIKNKVHFTGYIARKTPGRKSVQGIREELGLKAGEKLVVVTTGGGGDGYAVMDSFLTMLEKESRPIPFKSVLITGPFMPKKGRESITSRARGLDAVAYNFFSRMEKLMAAADLVICMGGYNTVCEIISQGTLSLLIPRDTPRKEQLIRARIFSEHKLVDYLPWNDLSPGRLRAKVFSMLENPRPYREAISRFRLSGIDVIRERLKHYRNCRS